MKTPADHARAARLCAFCPSLCRFACPVEAAEGREAASPRAMVGLLHHLATGAFPLGAEAAQAFTFCDGCGACVEVCEHDNPVPEILRAARASARKEGHTPPAYARIGENLAAGLSPAGQPLSAPLRPLRPERHGVPAEILVWPSDRALEQGSEALAETLAALDRLGVDWALPTQGSFSPSPRWADTLGVKALKKDLTRRYQAATEGYSRVFFEDPGDAANEPAGSGRVASWWTLRPEAGWVAPAPERLAHFLAPPAGVGEDFVTLARALGLSPLDERKAPGLSTGAEDLFDLVHPETAARMRDAVVARAGGREVLIWSPATARWLAEAGALVTTPAQLTPRR